MENKIKSLSLALLALSATSLCAADFEITSFGAKAGGDVLNTAAIQAAIDASSAGDMILVAGNLRADYDGKQSDNNTEYGGSRAYDY